MHLHRVAWSVANGSIGSAGSWLAPPLVAHAELYMHRVRETFLFLRAAPALMLVCSSQGVAAAARGLISDLASGIDEPQRIARLRAALRAPHAAPAPKAVRAADPTTGSGCACSSTALPGHRGAHAHANADSDSFVSGESAADVAARTEVLDALSCRAERLRLWEHALLRPAKPSYAAERSAYGMNGCAQIKRT
eukprot:5284077-Pleurochrysis_carterae.AAC.7